MGMRGDRRWGTTQERGAALFGTAVATAIVSSIAAYAALTIAMSQARQGKVLHERPRTHYAAEAALVVAQERLWRNPNDCAGAPIGGTAQVTQGIDTDGTGGADTFVDLSWTNCGAGRRHVISARVTY